MTTVGRPTSGADGVSAGEARPVTNEDESAWVSLALTRVEPRGVAPFEHHVVRMPGPAAGCIVTRSKPNEDTADEIAESVTEVLLLYRHRCITETWGWEVPAGGAESGEDPAVAPMRGRRGGSWPAVQRP